MQPAVALGVAVGCAAAAVAIVSVDLVYTLTAYLDSRNDGSWTNVARAPYDDAFGRAHQGDGFGCALQTMRLRVENYKPLPDSVRVEITYSSMRLNAPGTVLRETWDLEAFENREYEFRVPDSAFTSSGEGDPFVSVNIRVGELFLNSCVTQEA